MKVLLIFIILCTIVSSGFCWRFFHNGRSRGGNLGVPKNYKLTSEAKKFTRWFTQNLDHFNVTNRYTWQQRYYVNDEYFDNSKRNVAFLMIGGEAEASDAWMTYGDWVERGKKHKAILFQLEHRFYGKSLPTKDLSVDNLKYLTSEYALADLAVFVAAMNKKYKLSPKVKWIAFGGSYAGSLAAWSRLKYPQLIHGAVSSSAPLKSVVDFQEYYQVVAEDLRDISKECYAAVQKGTAQIDALVGKKSGQKTLTELFQLCEPLSESVNYKNDISNFYDALASNFAGIAQYNKESRGIAQYNKESIMRTKSTLLGEIILDTVCDIMTDSSLGDELTRLAKFNALISEGYDSNCLDLNYDEMVERFRNTSVYAEVAEGERQWLFQTCNEFGFYKTSDKKPQIFGNKFPTKFFIQQCMDIFGPKFNETFLNNATHRTNTIYGGLNIKVDNVVFVHGSVDPWHALGVTKTIYKGSPAIYINGTAHCADVFPPLDSDPPQLKAARLEIGQHIQTWLQS